MPYTYEQDKNGRWVRRGSAGGAAPVAGGRGFGGGGARPPKKRKQEERPWWWHVTPAGIANDLKYEGKRGQQFNSQPAPRRSVPPIMQLMPPTVRQAVIGSTVRAGSDAALAAVNLIQRGAANYSQIRNPVVRAAAGSLGPYSLPLLGLFGPARDPESTVPGKLIIAATRAGTKALGGRLPEEMRPEDKAVYEDLPAALAANVALGFGMGPMSFGIKGSGAAAKALRWGLNAAANEGASSLITDSTLGGPSSMIKATGAQWPDALSADPRRDDRVSAGFREIIPGMVLAAPLGAGAALLERLPHVARGLRENRTAAELQKARARTVDNGLQTVDPVSGEHSFTPEATTPPPPPAAPAPPKTPLERSAEWLGRTPEQERARVMGESAPAPEAPAAEPRQIPSLEAGTAADFGKAMPGRLPGANPALDPWEDDLPYQDWLQQNANLSIVPAGGRSAPIQESLPKRPLAPQDELRGEGLADPWGMGPDPNSPVQRALAGKQPSAEAAPAPTPEAPTAPKAPDADPAEEFYDPSLPEIDAASIALDRLDPAEVERIANTPGPVLPQIEEALANRQPVQARPALQAADVTAPTDKLAENEFITRHDEWSQLSTSELLGVFHPEVNPQLFDAIHAQTGRQFDELTRDDALQALTAMEGAGQTVLPSRLLQGVEIARVGDLGVDPGRFQFKDNVDSQGRQRGNSLEGVNRWNTSQEGVISVWEEPSTGKLWVINGHNRLAKAEELGIPTVPIKRLLASTPEQAMALGAMENIASGGGTMWDAAKFFKNSGINTAEQVQRAGVPLTPDSGNGLKGLQLAQLPDNILQAGIDGELSGPKALMLGGSGLSPEKMQSVWKLHQEDKAFRTEDGFQQLIDFTRAAPTTKADAGGRLKQGEIPGLESAAERDLSIAKMKLAAKIEKALAEDSRALRGAARKASTLETKGGSTIDAATSMQAGLDNEQLKRIFSQLKYSADNRISELLNQGAEEIAAGARADVVARRIEGELAEAAKGVLLPEAPRVEAPAPQPEPEAPAPRTAMDHEANILRVLNTAAAQGEVRPSATPILQPPAAPEVDVARVAKGLSAEDVRGGDSQLQFAQQQRQAAVEAGDTKGVAAWDKEIRKINQGRLRAEQARMNASQTAIPGTEPDAPAMPLFDDVQKLAAEEQRLQAEYQARDNAVYQEQQRAERDASGYHDKTFDQKVADHGIAEGWTPKTEADTPDTRGQGRFFHGTAQEIPGDAPNEGYWTDGNIFGNGFYTTDDFHTAGNKYVNKGRRQALRPEVPIPRLRDYGAEDQLFMLQAAGATSEEINSLSRATVEIPPPERLRQLADAITDKELPTYPPERKTLEAWASGANQAELRRVYAAALDEQTPRRKLNKQTAEWEPDPRKAGSAEVKTAVNGLLVRTRPGDTWGKVEAATNLAGRLRELADNPPQAKKFSPVAYEVSEKKAVKFYDMEQEISYASGSEVAKMLRSQGGGLWDEVKGEWERNGSMTYAEMLDTAREMSASMGWSRSDVTELFDSLNGELQGLGYGGLRHAGGVRAGGAKRLHEVRIYLNPAEQVSLRRIGAEGPTAAPRPAPKPMPPLTSRAGKELMKKIERLSEQLTNSRDVRLPAALDRRTKLEAQGLPLDRSNEELISQLEAAIPKLQKQLDDIRAEYGMDGPGELSSIASQEGGPEGWLSVGTANANPEEVALRRKFLTKLINEVAGDDVILRFNDVYETVQTPAAWGGTPGQTSLRRGHYTPAKPPDFVGDIITINGLAADGDLSRLTETAYHESWHRIQYLALGENEAKVLDSKWARFKIALGSGHLLDSRKIAYGESQAVAVMKYATARKAEADPVRYMLSQYQEADSRIWDLAHSFFSGVDRVLDFAEKMYNGLAGNGFISTRSILEDFYQGNLIATYDYSAAPIGKWFKKTWAFEAVPKFDSFTALTSVLKEADDGKLKGVSKRALKAAEEGDATQALAEARDYAQRRMDEIQAEIDSIKQRAIQEGC